MKQKSQDNVIYGVKGVEHLFPEETQELGVAKISKVEFKEKDDILFNLRLMRDAKWWFRVHEGKYVRLIVNGELMMSDTGMERYSNTDFIQSANGKVLIAGLGVGMVLHNILENPNVNEVIVIEKYQDVIDLVADKFKSDKLKIICKDIFDFVPEKGEKYDTIYFDIWASINTDNLEQIKTLHNRFKNKLNRDNPNCWMNSWMKEYLQQEKRKEAGSRYW